jgi:hypothetical protein
MPKKKGTALHRVKPDMPEHLKDRLAAYGALAFSREWDWACMVRQVVINNPGKAESPISKNPAHNGTIEALRKIVFEDVARAIATKDDRFFERMAEAVRHGKILWGETAQWLPRDEAYFDIVSAHEALIKQGKSKIRPVDIAEALHEKHDIETIRDRIKRYGIRGIDTRPGPQRKHKRVKRVISSVSLKEIKALVKKYKPSRYSGK